MKNKKNLLPVSENDILNMVCEVLEGNGHLFWRSNNTPIYDAGERSFRAMPKYAMKGVADILAVIDGTLWCFEVKKPHPKTYPSREQKEFGRRVREAGGIYEVIRSVEDMEKLGFDVGKI